MRIIFSTAVLAFLVGCASTPKSPSSMSLDEAVTSPYRSSENQKRDVYRHPKETLAFFGLEPDMTVVEITPGAGWYTEILAPYLAARGQFVAAIFPEGTGAEYMEKLNQRFMSWLKEHPDVGDKVIVTRFNLEEPSGVAPEGSADLVLTFRNVHNWMSQEKTKTAFEMFFKALKPGGTLGVVAHRAIKKSNPKKGYVTEADVIKMAESVGFKLIEKSEINANPKDTKNHPEGVWTLPPSLRLGEVDKEKYLAIGESDRMTLKFAKP